jgi:UDP-2,3-diacylglucosamine hydrolase
MCSRKPHERREPGEDRSAGRLGTLPAGGRPIAAAAGLRRLLPGHQGSRRPRPAIDGDDYREIGVGKLGTAIAYFRRRGVRRATMAGKLHKVLLFQRFAMWKHLPDWRAFRTFFPHWITKTKDRKDDTLLLAVVEAFAEDGIHFAPATDFVPELLVKPGNLSGREPTRGQWKDIQFGWQLAREMGRLDVGQSVAVKGRAVLAVEAVEGTDACIQRAGQLCPQGGFALVKVAKPQQDMRFDVPTIGIHTVRHLVEARAAVLAIEADKTIIVDEAEVVAYAAPSCRYGLQPSIRHDYVGFRLATTVSSPSR